MNWLTAVAAISKGKSVFIINPETGNKILLSAHLYYAQSKVCEQIFAGSEGWELVP